MTKHSLSSEVAQTRRRDRTFFQGAGLSLSVVAVSLALGPAGVALANEEVIYDLVSYTFGEEGVEVSGTLTTNGRTGRFPFVTRTDFQIVDWSVLITTQGPGGPAVEELNPNNSSLFAFTADLVITENEIFVDLDGRVFPPSADRFSITQNESPNLSLTYLGPTEAGIFSPELFPAREGSVRLSNELGLDTEAVEQVGFERTLIATLRVPEPSTFTGSLTFLTIASLTRRKRTWNRGQTL